MTADAMGWAGADLDVGIDAVQQVPTIIELDPGVPLLSAALAGSISLADVQRVRIFRGGYFGKRAFDLVFAVISLTVILLPLLLVMLTVVVTSPGPALYGQWRVGRDGRPFRCWKIRTMMVDADARLAVLLEGDAALRHQFDHGFKLGVDPRVTSIGRVLRRTGLDELPQLWNVLVGQMSVVGPRPFVEAERNLYGAALDVVLEARPGITGPWQIMPSRNAIPYAERVAVQEQYVRQHSVGRDLAIIGHTVAAVFRPGCGGL